MNKVSRPIMEKINNKLPDDVEKFFKSLSKYIEKPLYFYGSVQRSDYFPGSSDIDVDIFTDNVNSTISKMQHFLHTPRKNFKKVYWRLTQTGKMVDGYKLGYENTKLKFSAEFSIYDNKYKEGVLKEHRRKIVLPYYATLILLIIKFLYYDLHILPKDTYRYLKNKTMSTGIGLQEDQFFTINEKKINDAKHK